MFAQFSLRSFVALLTETIGVCDFRQDLGNWVDLFLLLRRQKTPYSIPIHILRFYFFLLFSSMCVCMCLQRPKALDPPEAGIIDSCEPLDMGVGN